MVPGGAVAVGGSSVLVGGGVATAVTTIRIGVTVGGRAVAVGTGVMVGKAVWVAVGCTGDGVKVGISVRVHSTGASATGVVGGTAKKVAPMK